MSIKLFSSRDLESFTCAMLLAPESGDQLLKLLQISQRVFTVNTLKIVLGQVFLYT